ERLELPRPAHEGLHLVLAAERAERAQHLLDGLRERDLRFACGHGGGNGATRVNPRAGRAVPARRLRRGTAPLIFGRMTRPVRPPAARVALAAGRAHDGATRSVGTVEVVEVDVAPLVGARVTRMHVDEGAVVRAGDTLVSLTITTTRPDIDAKRARLATAEA